MIRKKSAINSSDTLDRASGELDRHHGGGNRTNKVRMKMVKFIYHKGVFSAMQIAIPIAVSLNLAKPEIPILVDSGLVDWGIVLSNRNLLDLIKSKPVVGSIIQLRSAR